MKTAPSITRVPYDVTAPVKVVTENSTFYARSVSDAYDILLAEVKYNYDPNACMICGRTDRCLYFINGACWK
jgi:hypothetical protein